jgi:hypothetical protein
VTLAATALHGACSASQRGRAGAARRRVPSGPSGLQLTQRARGNEPSKRETQDAYGPSSAGWGAGGPDARSSTSAQRRTSGSSTSYSITRRLRAQPPELPGTTQSRGRPTASTTAGAPAVARSRTYRWHQAVDGTSAREVDSLCCPPPGLVPPGHPCRGWVCRRARAGWRLTDPLRSARAEDGFGSDVRSARPSACASLERTRGQRMRLLTLRTRRERGPEEDARVRQSVRRGGRGRTPCLARRLCSRSSVVPWAVSPGGERGNVYTLRSVECNARARHYQTRRVIVSLAQTDTE